MADKTESLLEALVAKLSVVGQSQGLSESQLERVLSAVGVHTAEAMRASLKPENPEHPHISAFSYPEGDIARPKPPLRVKTFFCGMEEQAERLTPVEIEAYNAITTDRQCRNGSWKAKIVNKGHTSEELHVLIPCETVDQRMGLPSLELILVELNGGPSTADLGGMIATIRRLEQELVEAKAMRGTATALEAELTGEPSRVRR